MCLNSSGSLFGVFTNEQEYKYFGLQAVPGLGHLFASAQDCLHPNL
jgi:hypothetical protein